MCQHVGAISSRRKAVASPAQKICAEMTTSDKYCPSPHYSHVTAAIERSDRTDGSLQRRKNETHRRNDRAVRGGVQSAFR